MTEQNEQAREQQPASEPRNASAIAPLGVGALLLLGSAFVAISVHHPKHTARTIRNQTQNTPAAAPALTPQSPPQTETPTPTPMPTPMPTLMPTPMPTLMPTPTRNPPVPVVQWRGVLMVSGPEADKDLDTVPPRTDVRQADISGDFLETIAYADNKGVVIATIADGSVPGYSACRRATETGGLDQTDNVREGDVLCIRTTQGRIARLVAIRTEQRMTGDPILQFNVTVWAY